jgi:predicted nucleic acid-binding protein
MLALHCTALCQALTHEWWAGIDHSKVWVSDLVVQEVAVGNPEAARRRLDLVEKLPIVLVTDQAQALAQRLMQAGVVPHTEPEDATHIAVAVTEGFQFLVTWNFAHFVSIEAKLQVMRVLEAWGYAAPYLVTPEELMESLKP